MPQQLRITLLGHVKVQRGTHIINFRRRKHQALLIYLAVTGQVHSRTALAELLWGDLPEASAQNNLRKALTDLRKVADSHLEIDRQHVAFKRNSYYWLDVEAFETKVRDASVEASLPQLEEAVALYRGDFMRGYQLRQATSFETWLLLEQERLRALMIRALQLLVKRVIQQGPAYYESGLAYANQLLLLDSWQEDAYQLVMILQALNGQRSAALAQYQRCREVLAEHLGVEPGASTTALYEHIRAGRFSEAMLPQWIGLDDWSREDTTYSTTDLSSLEVLTVGELSEPGSLPANAILPYRRNEDFVGREADLLRITAVLGATSAQSRIPVVAITGMGGLGKTQLAVEYCYRYGRYYPGGVFWMSFAEADNVAEEVAAIGGERGLALYQEAEPLTLADRVGRVQRAWQEPIPRLLIFDNCEEEDLLAQWLPTTGGCHVLLTSRRANWTPELHVTVLPLNVLRRPDSIALLQYLAPDLTLSEADEIAAEMGDLPLALHLAGSFLRRYKGITVPAYLAQLGREGLLNHLSLQGHGASFSPTGHERHVARTFALSLQQFDPNNEVDNMARRLLTHAACLTPGEPLPQELLRATAVSDDELSTLLLVEDGLMRLVAVGFLEAEGRESVVLHRLLAAFVVEVMVAEDALDVARTTVEDSLIRLLTPILQQAQFRGSWPVPASHLSYVTEMALARSSTSAALLALALGWNLRFVGEYASAQRYLEKGLAIAVATGDVYTQGRIVYILSRLEYSQGFHQEAQQKSIVAEQLFRQANVPNQAWLIAAIIRRGWADVRLGQAEPALAAAAEAWQLCLDTGNKSTLFECMNLLGSIQYFLLGDYEAADQSYETALDLARQMSRSNVASIIMNQGEVANMQGDYVRAKAKVQEALQITRRAGDRMRELAYMSNLSEAQMRLGEYDTAVANLTQVIAQAPTNWTYAPVAYLVLAEAYLGQGKLGEALTAVQAADSFEAENDPYNAGNSWRILGHIAFQMGQPIAPSTTSSASYTGSDCFARSLQIFTDIENKREEAIVLWAWANYELGQGDSARGKAMWQQAREIFVQLNLPLFVARMDMELA